MAVYTDGTDDLWRFDPEDLFHQTRSGMVYPISDRNDIPTQGAAGARWLTVAGPSGVLLSDGRVLHAWHEDGTGATGVNAQRTHRFLMGYAADEATYVGSNQSVTWADRVPLLMMGDGEYASGNRGQLAASISRAGDRLVMVCVSDIQHTSMEVGDRTRGPAEPGWLCSVSGTMYALGGSNTLLTDRLWTVDLDDGNCYVVNKLYSDDPVSATAWNVGNNMRALAHNGTSMFAVDDALNTLYTINLTDGTPSPIGGTGVTGELDMAWDGTTMWGITSTTLYTVNTGTGAWTSSVACAGLVSIAYDSTAGVMYGCSATTLYTVDTSTGALTSVGPLTLASASGLGYDAATDQLYVCDQTQVYLVTRSTGAAIIELGAPTHNNHVDWWPGWGTCAWVSDDEGETWRNGIGHYTWLEYTDPDLAPYYYSPPQGYADIGVDLRPFTYAVPNPTVGTHWALDARPGVVFRSKHHGWCVTTHVLHRDQTFDYNQAWPCVAKIRSLASSRPSIDPLWPNEDPVDISDPSVSYPDDYTEYIEGSSSTLGWEPGQVMTVRDAYGSAAGGDYEGKQELSQNLAEVKGHLLVGSYSHEGAGAREGSGRLLEVVGGTLAPAMRYMDNWYLQYTLDNSVGAMVRMDPGSHGGNWLLVMSGKGFSTTGGIYTGPPSSDMLSSFADFTYDGTALSTYSFTHPVRLVRGDDYVWFYRWTGQFSTTDHKFWGVQSTALAAPGCIYPTDFLRVPYPQWERDERWDHLDQNWAAFERWQKDSIEGLTTATRCRLPYPKARTVEQIEQNWLAVERWSQGFCWSKPYRAPRKRPVSPLDDEHNWYELVRWISERVKQR